MQIVLLSFVTNVECAHVMCFNVGCATVMCANDMNADVGGHAVMCYKCRMSS